MGPPHPSRRALRDACVSGKRICLRPPQDEADKQPSSVLPIHCERDTRQWVMDFCSMLPAPDIFDWSFGEPTYRMVPAPETRASSSSFAFTVTSPAPLTTTVARLVCRSTASREPAPLTVIDRLLDRPAKLPLAAPEIEIDSESVSSLVALTVAAPLLVSLRNSRTVTLMRGPLPFQVGLFPSATPMKRVPSLTSVVNSGKRLSSTVSSRLSSPVCSISRFAEPEMTMAVKFSTTRVSVLRLPEPLITSPPNVSDQSQAASRSKDERTAAIRNMARGSRNGRND